MLRKMFYVLFILIIVSGLFFCQNNSTADAPVPVIHVTDLYTPAGDPDDHWDLACEFALAYQEKIDLKGIVIDCDPDNVLNGKRLDCGDPDVRAVAQMNYITGLSVPAVIGTRGKIQSTNLKDELASRKDLGAVNFILKTLEESPQPVVIHVTGTARDVALAGHADPQLFTEKCKAIYYNAGLSRNDGKSGEYNTGLDKIGYAALFNVPCPIYWMPCFSAGSGWHKFPDRREELYGDRYNDIIDYETFWKFTHEEILSDLSENTQKFFAYMYENYKDYNKNEPVTENFLRYLYADKNEDIIQEVNPSVRHMWCTAGFLHAAGLCVDKNGTIQPLDDAKDNKWYRFEPAKITSDDNGATTWSIDADAKDRFIFRHLGWDQYNESMKKGAKELLLKLP